MELLCFHTLEALQEVNMTDKEADLLTKPTLFGKLGSSEGQSEDGARKSIPHVAAKHLESAALIRVFVQQVCPGKVGPHTRVAGTDWKVGAVGVEINNSGARYKGRNICEVVA